MKKILFMVLIVSFLILNAEEEDTMTRLVEANNKFSFEMYKNLKEKNSNVFFSSYSILNAMSMTAEGAACFTKEEMLQSMFLPENDCIRRKGWKALTDFLETYEGDKNVEFNAANSLWMQRDFEFNPKFEVINNKIYNAEINRLNFKGDLTLCKNKINNWVSENTNEKIQNIIDESFLSSRTRLVLANAIYFKAAWKNQFQERNTREMDFYTDTENSKKLDMMYQKEKFLYNEGKKFKILSLPYKNRDFSMVIALPIKKDSLPDLKDEDFKRIMELEKKGRPREVRVFLPKFKLDFKSFLNNNLKDLGIRRAFTSNADFSGIEPKKSLFISNVIHQAFLEVNEEGSEAAAATVVGMKILEMEPEKPVEFKADHPFFFFIRNNKNGLIMFMGEKIN